MPTESPTGVSVLIFSACRTSSIGAAYEENNLALGRLRREKIDEFAGRAPVIGLVNFCEFASNANGSGGVEFGEGFQGGENPKRRFVENAGVACLQSRSEDLLPFAGFDREETAKKEGITGETGADQGGDEGGGPGQYGVRYTSFL